MRHSLAVIAKLALGIVLLFAHGHAASAGELKALSVVPMKTSLDALAPQFERATGHKLTVNYAGSSDLIRKFDAGETFDVALVWPAMIDRLLKEGKAAAGTRADIARVGIGVAVKKGAAHGWKDMGKDREAMADWFDKHLRKVGQPGSGK